MTSVGHNYLSSASFGTSTSSSRSAAKNAENGSANKPQGTPDVSKSAYNDILDISEEAKLFGLEPVDMSKLSDKMRDLLSKNSQTSWTFQQGYEALQGHEILNTGIWNVDEYGMSFSVPGVESYYSNGTMWKAPETQPVEVVQYDVNGKEISRGPYVDTQPIDLTIKSVDQVGLGSMSLDNRKTFLDRLQTLIDQSDSPALHGMKATSLHLEGVFISKNADPNVQDRPDLFYDENLRTFYVTANRNHDFSPESMSEIEKLINSDSVLQGMYKETYVRDRLGYENSVGTSNLGYPESRDNFSIKITDENGNRLANNELIVSLDSKELRMTVEQYKSKDRKEIVDLVRSEGTKVSQETSANNVSSSQTQNSSDTNVDNLNTSAPRKEIPENVNDFSLLQKDTTASEQNVPQLPLWMTLKNGGTLAKLLGVNSAPDPL
ncbi:MAG: hypothetical protein ACRC2T_09500, partial [Thermoguttaceae bacterium]